jgi:hypothetical protein
LAGKSTADEIDRSESCCAGVADVDDVAIGVRPVLCEDAAAEFGLLDLPDRSPHAGPFQSELEKSDTGKE